MQEIQEWKPQNKLNSFNSFKGLAYFPQYKQIMAWMKGESNYLPPPIECNLDPYAECNLACSFCIVQRYIKNHREEVGTMRKLPLSYILSLIDFLGKWGVKGLCLSGGGEPTLHDGLASAITYANSRRLDVSLVTNMVNISHPIMESMPLCRWVAMSVDAADAQTYLKVKGRDKFREVCANIELLSNYKTKTNSKMEHAYKMLVLEENYKTIHKACKLAKELGVVDFHVRPVDLERNDIEGHKKQQLNMKIVQEQFAKCHEEETDSFHVYTITHKFDQNFHNIQNFKHCLATPLLIPVLTDGNYYVCVDKKMQAKYKIGSAFPNPEVILETWGSEQHRNLIKSIIPKVNCADCRCTFQAYNLQCEELVEKDSMCLSFP